MANKEEKNLSDNLQTFGYAGKVLRVMLSKGEGVRETLERDTLRKYLGGAALGVKYLYDEVTPGIEWSDSENRFYIGTGPLGGTKIGGSGTICVVTKGPMTNGLVSSQANGYFGAFLKFSGFDAIILQDVAPEWSYLYIHDGKVEIKDAKHLLGKNTFEVDYLIKQELKKRKREVSVLSIGPAGENLVRFSGICVDQGHMAAHNGSGAVLGSKKIKAIAVERCKSTVPLKDVKTIDQLAKDIKANMLKDKMSAQTFDEGTIGGVQFATLGGLIPVKNYQTSIHKIDPEKLETYSAKNIRSRFRAKRDTCWACSSNHSQTLEIQEGKYAGRVFDEPEYEGMAAFSALVGIDDVETTLVLASEVDRLGMDCNESGWLFSWLMECSEKGILTKDDTDGLDMKWGNGDAIMTMMNKIAKREGFGNILAEGVMRAAQHVGGEAKDIAIHTQKGNTPRGHDHRILRLELFTTCVSNLGTLETHGGVPFELLGMERNFDLYDPIAVSTVEAKIKGAMVFEDSLVTCRFQTANALDLLCDAVNAATGWDIDIPEAMSVGRRAVNLARAFNLRHGIPAELDAPSPRYGSTPVDGPAEGKNILDRWPEMLDNYYNLMGWDEKTGKPLPETLKEYDLDYVIPHIWE